MPRYHKTRYERICIYCSNEFLSKKKDGKVCYSDPCQRQLERDKTRKRYLKVKERLLNA